jgi:putative ABC transport system permease protein
MRLLRPRWRKILADLWGNKARTLLVVLSIAVGTFAVGLVSSAYIILSKDLDIDYRSVNPHDAIIYSDAFDDDFLQTIQRLPEIGQAEGRSAVFLRVVDGPDKKVPIMVSGIPELNEIQIDRLRPTNDQPLALPDHEIFLERTALRALDVKAGDTITLELRGNRTRQLRVAALVHDVTNVPYTFTGQITGYVNQDTMTWLGGISTYNQMYITVAQNRTSQEHLTQVANMVVDKIEDSGRQVTKSVVSLPGKHFASDFLAASSILLGALGTLALILSAFLAVNIISSLLSQHVRQIGIMKLIGGQTDQLVRMYISLVFCFGILSLIIAIPLSALLSYRLSGLMASFMNFNLGPFRISWISVALQVAVALVIPVLTALVPVLRGARLTVRAAISDYGVSLGSARQSRIDQFVDRVRSLPRPMLLSLRNVFRRKGRLVLTLFTLTLGGSIFIAVFNVRASLQSATQQTLGYFLSDVNLNLARAHRFQQIEPLIRSIPGVVAVEGWSTMGAQIYAADRSSAEDVSILAPPAQSELIKPVMQAGRWLQPGDENAMVVSNAYLKKRPDLKIGDWVEVKINGKDYPWRVIGVCSIAGHLPIPVVYTNKEYLEKELDTIDQVSEFHIVTSPQDYATQKSVAHALEAKLKSTGLQISRITTGIDNSTRLVALINMMVIMLLIMAVIIAMVGGLGLTGMMSQNVMERTREIGVMRAIGASDRSIQQIVMVEGVLIGLISWIFAVILAIPFSIMLENAMGEPITGGALPQVLFNPNGPLLWLIGVVVLSALSSFIPAYNASRLTIREILAYE